MYACPDCELLSITKKKKYNISSQSFSISKFPFIISITHKHVCKHAWSMHAVCMHACCSHACACAHTHTHTHDFHWIVISIWLIFKCSESMAFSGTNYCKTEICLEIWFVQMILIHSLAFFVPSSFVRQNSFTDQHSPTFIVWCSDTLLHLAQILPHVLVH